MARCGRRRAASCRSSNELSVPIALGLSHVELRVHSYDSAGALTGQGTTVAGPAGEARVQLEIRRAAQQPAGLPFAASSRRQRVGANVGAYEEERVARAASEVLRQ